MSCTKVYNSRIALLMDDPDSFYPWDGDYEKVFYDVLLPDGEIVKSCYPNAGKMLDIHGTGRKWTVEDNIKIKLSAEHPLDKYWKDGN